ncbi:heparin lyase I family protein [Pseudanabaena phage Pan5]|nr:heparin lyase I family protein [Pseudanabaena phage Pan5]
MRLLTILLFLPLLTTAQKRMTSSFEGNVLDSITFYEGCCGHSAIKSAHRKYVGNHSARIELRRNDPEVETGSNRVELNVNSTNTLANRYEWRWWKFSTYIPSDSNAIDAPNLDYVMGQIKQPGTGGVQTGGSPPLGFIVRADSVYLDIRWATAANPNSDNASNLRRYFVGLRGEDQWVHYVVDYQRTHLPTGVVRVWRNDILVVNDTGRNYFEDAAIPSIKWGLYCYRWASVGDQGSVVPYRVLYLDAIGVYGASSTYEDVATFRATSNPPVVTVPNYTTTNSSITLTASVTSDNPIVDYSWSGLTGPNTPSVSVPAAGQITLSGLINGTYTWQITVTDSEGQTDTAVSTITKTEAIVERVFRFKKKQRIKGQ